MENQYLRQLYEMRLITLFNKAFTNGFILSFIIALLICFTSSKVTFGKDVVKAPHKVIVFGGDQNYPPYTFLKNGKPTGFSVELIQAVGKVMDSDVKIKFGLWKDIFPAVLNGEIDTSDAMVTNERLKEYDFSVPITEFRYVLFIHKDSTIRLLNDIRDKNIIVENGDFMHDYLKKTHLTSHIVPMPSTLDALKLLNSDRYDGAFAPRVQGLYYINKYHLKNIKPSEAMLPSMDYAFAVKKGNQNLVRDIDEGLNILKENGSYKRLYNKWFGVYEQTDYLEKFKYYIYSVALIIALLLISFAWTCSLKRQVKARTAELNEKIEQRRLVEEALRDAEAKYRALVDNNLIGVYLIQNNKFIYVNPRFAEIFGYTQDELIGAELINLVDQESRSIVIENIQKRLSAETPNSRYIFKGLRKDGEVIDIEVYGSQAVYKGILTVMGSLYDVTERKKNIEALQQSEEDFRLIFEHTLDIVFRIKNNVIILANSVVVNILGYEPNEVLGLSPWDISPEFQPDGMPSKEKALDLLTSVSETGVRFEWVHRHKNGKLIDCEVDLVAYKINENEYVQAIVRDITERKHVEKALLSSEHRLADIINFLPDPTFAIDLEGKVIAWSRAVEEMTGVKAEEMLGSCEYAVPFYGKQIPMLMGLVLLSDEETEKKYPFFVRENNVLIAENYTPTIKQGGTYLWGKASPLYDQDGNIVGAIETIRDITERKKAENELREQKELLQRVMDNIPEFIFWKDVNSVYLGCNKSFAMVNKFEDPASVAGKTDYDFRAHEEADLSRASDKRVMDSDTPIIHLIELRQRADGAKWWLDISKLPLHDADGKVVGILGIYDDITQSKLAEEELRERREHERKIHEDAEAAKREFYKGTISAVTDGKLNLVTYDDIESLLAPNAIEMPLYSSDDMARLRTAIMDMAENVLMANERILDLITAFGEAAANAIKHANGGIVRLGVSDNKMQICIRDKGPGIDTLVLPNATLMSRFSTKKSMGLGYSLILALVDSVHLATESHGTCILLEKYTTHPNIKINLNDLPDTW